MNKAPNAILRGDLKTLVRIAIPLMLFLSCESVATFFERIFLSHYSLEAVHASLNASYLATIFQDSGIAIGAMGQVFVGLYYGSGENRRIGPCIWQLIWFSFLSLLVTVPLSYLASHWYFRGTSIQGIGVSYFKVLILGNFLFPLSVSLSSFYLGRGKTFFVTSLMLLGYGLNVLLCWFLVFGIKGIIPSLGAQGGSLAKCISLGVVCGILLSGFLRRKNRTIYQTSSWRFLPKPFLDYMRQGMFRASGYISSKICWVAISYIIIKKGGEYLNVLTVGGTVIMFLVFTTRGIYRAILTIASNLIGL